jgi:CheY-like chemotaxis protein
MDISLGPTDAGSSSGRPETPAVRPFPVAIREIFDAIPLAIALVDIDLRCVELNRCMAAKIGRSREMCLGQQIADVVPQIATKLESRLLEVLAGNIVEDSALPDAHECAAFAKCEVHSFAALRNENGVVSAVLWTVLDDGPRVLVSQSEPGIEKWRILMAEDLPMNQQIIAQMLESVGYEVITVADGASAVDVVRREPVDLILMDIEMPLMGGLEATSAIRAQGAAVPIVAMTANQGPEQLAACRGAGMDAYICKPVNRQDLISTIRRWLKTSYKVAPAQRSEQRNPIDLGILDNIRVHFGPLKTHRFIEEVHTRLENVLLQLTNGTDSRQLASDLHSLVSMGGHLGLRDLSEKARALMVALRKNTNNVGMAREDFRSAAMRTLMALHPEELPGHLMVAGVEDPKTKVQRVFQ